MRGISEEEIKEMLREESRLDIKIALNYLINQCKELNPWLPIDENTPRDRSILLLWPQEIGGAMQGYWLCDAWYCDMWELTGSLMSNQPTHYKLLTEDPK